MTTVSMCVLEVGAWGLEVAYRRRREKKEKRKEKKKALASPFVCLAKNPIKTFLPILGPRQQVPCH